MLQPRYYIFHKMRIRCLSTCTCILQYLLYSPLTVHSVFTYRSSRSLGLLNDVWRLNVFVTVFYCYAPPPRCPVSSFCHHLLSHLDSRCTLSTQIWYINVSYKYTGWDDFSCGPMTFDRVMPLKLRNFWRNAYIKLICHV